MPCSLKGLWGRRVGQLPMGPEEETPIRSLGHGTPTALRYSPRAALYSSSVATQTTTSPDSVVEGLEIALNPRRHEPSSMHSSTRCPGSATRGGPFKKSGNHLRTARP